MKKKLEIKWLNIFFNPFSLAIRLKDIAQTLEFTLIFNEENLKESAASKFLNQKETDLNIEIENKKEILAQVYKTINFCKNIESK